MWWEGQGNDITSQCLRAVEYILLSVILGPNKASYSNYKLSQSQFWMQGSFSNSLEVIKLHWSFLLSLTLRFEFFYVWQPRLKKISVFPNHFTFIKIKLSLAQFALLFSSCFKLYWCLEKACSKICKTPETVPGAWSTGNTKNYNRYHPYRFPS